MNMKLAVDKTVILTAGDNSCTWKVDDDSPDLIATLVAKYLGVSLSVKGRNLVKAREEKMVSSARAFAHTIMGLTQSGLDRAITAHKLWEVCAIPSILYATKQWSYQLLLSGNWIESRTVSRISFSNWLVQHQL